MKCVELRIMERSLASLRPKDTKRYLGNNRVRAKQSVKGGHGTAGLLMLGLTNVG